MELDNCIRERRSIRSYLDKEVEWEKIAKILDSARYAPSSGNLQNWSFIVVKDKKKKNELTVASLKQYWMLEAPVFIVVCNKLENMIRYYGNRGENLYGIQNVAAAIQNMLLTAHHLGLATCWVGAFDDNAIKRILKLPENVKPEAIITIGYIKEREEMPFRQPLEIFTFFEEWNKKERDTSLWPIIKHKEAIREKLNKKTKSIKEFFKKK